MSTNPSEQDSAFTILQQASDDIHDFFQTYTSNKPKLLAKAVLAINWLWNGNAANKTRNMSFIQCCKLLDIPPYQTRRDMFLTAHPHRTDETDLALRNALGELWVEVCDFLILTQPIGQRFPQLRKPKTASHSVTKVA